MKKTLVIFGSGEGISFEVAQKFLENQFNVVLVSRSAEKLAILKTKLGQMSNNVSSFVFDVTDQSQLNHAIDAIKESNKTIDVVLYNAAKVRQGNILEESFASLIEDFKVNVAALVPIVQKLKDSLSESKGALLITGGGIGINPNPAFASLSLGKAALRNLTLSISETLSESNIFVGTILVNNYVSKNSHLHSPRNVADVFWNLYLDRSVREIIL